MQIPSFKINTPAGMFHVSGGNSKVQFPIINVGAAMDCPSRQWCPFDKDNHKEAGRKLCYAQKNERIYKTALDSRRNNERIIRELDEFDTKCLAIDIAGMIKDKTRRKRIKSKDLSKQFVRINESSDLSNWNICFVSAVIKALKAVSINVYLYSKAPLSIRAEAIGAGAKVLHSERDFVGYGSIEELEQSDSIACPGECGPCVACPTFNGKTIGVLEH